MLIFRVADGYKKEGLVGSKDRLEMCKLACEETSSWLMVDAWEELQKQHTRTAIVLDHFNYEINEIRGGALMKTGARKKVKIMLLIGSDLLQSMMTLPVWEERDVRNRLNYWAQTQLNSYIIFLNIMDALLLKEGKWMYHVKFLNTIFFQCTGTTLLLLNSRYIII